MKKANLFISLITIISILFWIACGKEGPQGIPGPAGNAGTVGKEGPAGKEGNALLSGKGSPDGKTGNTGDYYLDKNSGNFYGPKTEKGWGTPVTFGDKEGSIILSGNNTPDAAIGSVGDFYLDTIHYLLYGPKTDNSKWGTGFLLQGSGPNAGVMAYSIDSPYNYIVADPNNTYGSAYNDNEYGIQLQIPYDKQNNFDLWTDVNEKNYMVEVYLHRTETVRYNNEDSTRVIKNYVPAEGNIKFGDFGEDELYCSAEIFPDVLRISFDGLQCGDCTYDYAAANFQDVTNITSILVFVISPSAVLHVSPTKPDPPDLNRGTINPALHSQIQQLINPYLKTH